MNVDEIRHYVKNGCRQHREVKSTKFLKCHHLSIPSLSIGRNHHDVKNITVVNNFWILFPDSIVDHVGNKMTNNVTNISNTGMKMIIDNSRSKAIQSDK